VFFSWSEELDEFGTFFKLVGLDQALQLNLTHDAQFLGPSVASEPQIPNPPPTPPPSIFYTPNERKPRLRDFRSPPCCEGLGRFRLRSPVLLGLRRPNPQRHKLLAEHGSRSLDSPFRVACAIVNCAVEGLGRHE